MTPERLAAHLRLDRYGAFRLTDAVRPSPDLPIVPRQGYRIDRYRDPQTRLGIPVLAAAVSRESLFEVFLSLVGLLGATVDVVLETSHGREDSGHKDLYRHEIDRPVLESYLIEFEDLLLNDGCTGVAVIGTDAPAEVQFDEHKLLIVYARDLRPVERILAEASVLRDDAMKLITEAEHLHTTDPRFLDAFCLLSHRLGVSQAAERISW